MKRTETKTVQIKKKTSYNIYGLNNRTFYVIAALICAVIIDALIQMPIKEFPLPGKNHSGYYYNRSSFNSSPV